MDPTTFLAQIAPAAMQCHAKHGIPASFTLAQAALESAWGASQLAKRGCNLFGVKADKAWKGPCINFDTFEVILGKRVLVPARWRAYSTWLDCIMDRAKFFTDNKRYAACFNETTGEGWARAVQAAKYATDPDYADKVIAVINFRNLTQYDHAGA